MAVPENGDLHRTMWGKPIISHHVQRNSYIYRGGKQNRCLVTKGSVSYLSSLCFSTSLGGIGGPARGIHAILAVMYWISIIRRGGPPPKMVMGSIPTGDAVTGPHIRGTLSMREMSL